jgi:hypothetical protein
LQRPRDLLAFGAASLERGGYDVQRLSGGPTAVAAVREQVRGEALADRPALWGRIRKLRESFFAVKELLWRLSVGPETPL